MTNNVQYLNIEPNWLGVQRWAEAGLRGATTRKDKATFAEILRMCGNAPAREEVARIERDLRA